MTSIWTKKEGANWQLTDPKGFQDEDTLHSLIEDTPGMLPLAGDPSLVVLGREAPLGSGLADLLAVESDGRPVIIEVKLSQNAEAKRAIVAQALAYAAWLHGYTLAQLQEGPLKLGFQQAEYETIVDAVRDAVRDEDQDGGVDRDEFEAALEENLREGRFRIVFVLDEAPPELSTLVAYLENVTNKLAIDLITVSSFEIRGEQVVIPQRVTPERHEAVIEQSRKQPSEKGITYNGSEEYERAMAASPGKNQAFILKLLKWARELENRNLVNLYTYRGIRGHYTLLPKLRSEGVGLVTIWDDWEGSALSLWRSVFERKAPAYVKRVEKLIAPYELGQGKNLANSKVTDELLDTLAEAYEAAANSS